MMHGSGPCARHRGVQDAPCALKSRASWGAAVVGVMLATDAGSAYLLCVMYVHVRGERCVPCAAFGLVRAPRGIRGHPRSEASAGSCCVSCGTWTKAYRACPFPCWSAPRLPCLANSPARMQVAGTTPRHPNVGPFWTCVLWHAHDRHPRSLSMMMPQDRRHGQPAMHHEHSCGSDSPAMRRPLANSTTSSRATHDAHVLHRRRRWPAALPEPLHQWNGAHSRVQTGQASYRHRHCEA